MWGNRLIPVNNVEFGNHVSREIKKRPITCLVLGLLGLLKVTIPQFNMTSQHYNMIGHDNKLKIHPKNEKACTYMCII